MMSENVLLPGALERVKAIHQLSLKYNRLVGKPHQERLLELMRHHIEEIEELARGGDEHYLIETGDLLVLCCELLLEAGASVNGVTTVCFGRYEKKLQELINAASGG
jgi:hypothetical protein